ncbi:phosphate propanoyltransferase [Proteinivorax hydrogeniformans]|uniref:Phosphate propanoyltransferase n=1 Tax=Proteinivorax hydrogeniformans TaxID=1826727 RepID=A0AAU8HX89_9FIRM
MTNKVPVGVSNRHLHLSSADIETLFGAGYELKPLKELSQPGQYAAEEVVTVLGPKGSIEKVRVLGPARNQTQVEVSKTDSFKLGITPPVRDSGDLSESSSIILKGPKGQVELKEGAIIAQRHIHMHTSDAEKLGLKDKQLVSVKTEGKRSVIFNNVLARVKDSFALEFHIDTDEANCAELKNGELVEIIK